jgi:ribosomal peptide maturation radical SAM protein 1
LAPKDNPLIEPAPEPEMANAQVVLVCMPYCPITRPSLALGVLKACLDGTGVSCAIEYANLRFADRIGLDALRVISSSRNEHLIGEWTFSAAAFPHHRIDIEEAIGRETLSDLLGRHPEKQARLDKVFDVWHGVRDLAPHFVEETARRVLARHPRIVGCTSTFEQQTASLALLRRIKEIDPSVVTMLGGANCEAEMGWAVIQEFPWVDFVVSGEADEIFAPLVKMVLKKGAKIDPVFLPQGVLTAAHVRMNTYGPGGKRAPRAVIEHLDDTPVPNFDEFFSELEHLSIKDCIVPALPLESSRGCWWGDKSHCTFCGLNGEGMRFRAKSPERVLSEFETLSKRHDVTCFQMADNILDMHHLRTVIPALAEAGAPYDLFYEIKANLRREQVQALAAGGVVKVQPGVESLHDGLLKLMAKGSSASINIELLKHLREVGISCVWLFLADFPGETDDWHREVAEWLPLLHHLQPPSDVVPVRFDRFSVYHQEPEKHGLKLVPYPAYAAIYPSTPEKLLELAYFFRNGNAAHRPLDTPGIALLRVAVRNWYLSWCRDIPPVLCIDDDGETISIFDTRGVAVERRMKLTGLEAKAYRSCSPPMAREALRKQLCAAGAASAEEAETIIAGLIAKRIVLDTGSKLVSLAVPGDIPPMRGLDPAAGGWTIGFDRPFESAIDIARTRLKQLRQPAEEQAPEPAETEVTV